MTELREVISKNLKKYRKRAKINQTELARQLGISPSSVSNWEQGLNSIDIDTLFKVCTILKVPISKMTEVDDHPPIDCIVNLSDTKKELIDVIFEMSNEQAAATLEFVKRLEAYAQLIIDSRIQDSKRR